MVAVDVATATGLLRRPVTENDVAKRRLIHVLSRSLADEGIPDDLITTLEEVLSDRPGAVAPARKMDGLLARFGLPAPRQRPPEVCPLGPEDAARISDHFRRATRLLVQITPHRVAFYPTEELRLLIALSNERPDPSEALSYLRRYALAIVALLDLMGDDEE
ncbi:hypothetical protein [Streptomyces noursei]|uniref:hypothetical protein n=1 Tax=Streptomyces noursei TaxID=1971 RepID=UPI00045EE5B1|nr:hypothetical protein [Streptomyces noursei]AIA06712.1 hypothetical protein DC74_6273 [Streptomyces noursei]